MTARDVLIAAMKTRGLANPEWEADAILNRLQLADYSIVHESEIHGPTRERCAIAANGEDDVVLAVEAIRALPDGGVE